MSRLIWPKAIVKKLHKRITNVNIYLRRAFCFGFFFLKNNKKKKVQFIRLQKINVTKAALILLIYRLSLATSV